MRGIGGRLQENAAIFQISPTDEVADPAQEHGALGVNEAPIVVGKEGAAGDGSAVDELAKGVRQPARDLTDIVISQEPTVDGRRHQVARARRRVQGDAGVRIDQEPEHLYQRALGRRLLAVKHQDGIRTDRPQDRRQPGDHQAKISLGEVNVGPQQVDRAVAAGHGKRQ